MELGDAEAHRDSEHRAALRQIVPSFVEAYEEWMSNPLPRPVLDGNPAETHTFVPGDRKASGTPLCATCGTTEFFPTHDQRKGTPNVHLR